MIQEHSLTPKMKGDGFVGEEGWADPVHFEKRHRAEKIMAILKATIGKEGREDA